MVFSIKEMGLYSMLPYITMVIGSNASGWAADYFIKRYGNITFVRKTFHTISLVGGQHDADPAGSGNR